MVQAKKMPESFRRFIQSLRRDRGACAPLQIRFEVNNSLFHAPFPQCMGTNIRRFRKEWYCDEVLILMY